MTRAPVFSRVWFKNAKRAVLGQQPDPDRSPPDELAAHGRELYLHLPRGVSKTKLTNAYLDRTLGTTSTLRNWRTVLQLAELIARRSRGPAGR